MDKPCCFGLQTHAQSSIYRLEVFGIFPLAQQSQVSMRGFTSFHQKRDHPKSFLTTMLTSILSSGLPFGRGLMPIGIFQSLRMVMAAFKETFIFPRYFPS